MTISRLHRRSQAEPPTHRDAPAPDSKARETSAPHAVPLTAITAALDVDPVVGLSDLQAREHFERDGPNELTVMPPPTLVALFARQFKSAIVVLLVVAAVVSFATGDAKDAVVILAILVVNGLIGAVQEARAERALQALRAMTPAHARVRRGGTVRDILAREVVLGDVVLLQAGDIVPADGRLLSVVSLAIDESTLTGELMPVEKDPAAPCEAAAIPGDRLEHGVPGHGGHGWAWRVDSDGCGDADRDGATRLVSRAERPSRHTA